MATSMFRSNQRALDFLATRQACPKGIFLTALPEDAGVWHGVLFVRQGPYFPGVFRFDLIFTEHYPDRPPHLSFTSEVFHPLVSPATTYQVDDERDGERATSASGEDRLPPGTFSFLPGSVPWLGKGKVSTTSGTYAEQQATAVRDPETSEARTPLPVELLYYLRAAFCSEELLNGIPLDMAANPSAWYAWQAHRTRAARKDSSTRIKSEEGVSDWAESRFLPGGARSPGQWDWDGVWEERVRNCVRNSLADQTLYKDPALKEDAIQFAAVDDETLRRNTPWRRGSPE